MKCGPKLGDANEQFRLNQDYYLNNLDFVDWYRYYFTIKEVTRRNPRSILEIGIGNRVVERCLENFVEEYMTMDVNPNLGADVVGDLRDFRIELKGRFDIVICEEVLEHMPYEHISRNLDNIFNYLKDGGAAVVTVPSRRISFLMITPSYKHHLFAFPLWLHPANLYTQLIKKKIFKDPHHCWEIGIGKHESDLRVSIRDAGFEVAAFKKLLYADMWILLKKRR